MYDFSNLQNTERGKKINAAMVQTGRYVEQAGKAVGKYLCFVKCNTGSDYTTTRVTQEEMEGGALFTNANFFTQP